MMNQCSGSKYLDSSVLHYIFRCLGRCCVCLSHLTLIPGTSRLPPRPMPRPAANTFVLCATILVTSSVGPGPLPAACILAAVIIVPQTCVCDVCLPHRQRHCHTQKTALFCSLSGKFVVHCTVPRPKKFDAPDNQCAHGKRRARFVPETLLSQTQSCTQVHRSPSTTN